LNSVFKAVVTLGGLGLAFGVLLAVASKVFHVEVDPKITKIKNALPGANCGACGYPGCDALAKAIAEGKEPANSCPVGGSETTKAVSSILGVETGEDSGGRKVARVLCSGCDTISKKKFDYKGIEDCKAASMIQGGDKACDKGCLGYGTCLEVCNFDAIRIEDGIAVIDPEKCTACGLCLEACPKDVIEWVPYEQEVVVDCKNQDFGKAVKDMCQVGCIGCGICEKSCPFDAIHVEDNIAKIDYDKCTGCMICTEKCPTNAISGELEKRKKAFIIAEKCIGCTICAKNCPVDCIDGKLKEVHVINQDDCIGCSVCFEKCPKDAIEMR